MFWDNFMEEGDTNTNEACNFMWWRAIGWERESIFAGNTKKGNLQDVQQFLAIIFDITIQINK